MNEQIAIIIPAHNEEKVIGKTLEILTSEISPSQIYVASDASTDKTNEIVKSWGANLMSNRKNLGKTLSLEKIIKKFKLLQRYEYVMFLDADSYPINGFFKHALKNFKDNKIACVCGQVITEEKANPFIRYRSVMYFIWQTVYKRVCSVANAVTIAPGTSSIYTAKSLKYIQFDKSIIIEDFDMTYQIHRKKLGKIIFESKAKIITQDPDNLRDYFRQCTRWQLGFFQTAKKHKIPFLFQPFDIAILLLLGLDILHSLYIFTLLAVGTYLVIGNPHLEINQWKFDRDVVLFLVFFDLALLWLLSLMQNFSVKRLYTIYLGPILWLIQFINILAFIKALYDAIFRSISGAWISPTRR